MWVVLFYYPPYAIDPVLQPARTPLRRLRRFNDTEPHFIHLGVG